MISDIEDRDGQVDGRHYTEWVSEVDRLWKTGDDVGAETLLLTLVEATEREAEALTRATGQAWPPAPWYYERLAILYRRRADYNAEVKILERWFVWPEDARTATSHRVLARRLTRARLLLDRAAEQ